MPETATTPPESSGQMLPPRKRKPAVGAVAAPADPLRPFPASEQAEKAALCCMLRDPEECLGGSMGKVRPEAFHTPSHRVIFEAMAALYDQKQRLDLVTLTQSLHDQQKLNEAGGPAFLAEVSDYVPTNALFDQYVEVLEEKRMLREIISSCTGCISRAYDAGEGVGELLDEVETRILGIRDQQGKQGVQTMKGEVLSALNAFDKMMKNRGAITGIETGFQVLDRMTDGLHEGEMIVIAARPSMGKTSFVMNVVEHVACDLNKAVLVFSLEMSANQLVQRLLCARGRVSMKKFRDGFASKGDFNQLMSVGKVLASSKLFIDDTPSISVMELRAKARRVHQQHQLSLIAIDYLQLMRSTSPRARDNRQIEISEISSGIKALAKELKVPIVVLAQLNRNPEKRESKKPMLSDLRESGSIEQDADLVGLLVRDSYYSQDAEEGGGEKNNNAELIVAKQRNGPTGDVPLVFLSELMRFHDRAPSDMEPDGHGE